MTFNDQARNFMSTCWILCVGIVNANLVQYRKGAIRMIE